MLIYCLWRFLRAFILACVEFIVYFSIKTYLFYFTQLFFKNTTLNYLYTLRFIKYYFFINFYLFINSPKSYLPSPQTKTTISLITVFLSKPIKPKTHTHTHSLFVSLTRGPHGNHSLTSTPPTPPRQINSKSIHNSFCNDPNNQILPDLIGYLVDDFNI